MNYQNLTKKIHPNWKPFFDQTKDEIEEILEKVKSSREKGNNIFPKKK